MKADSTSSPYCLHNRRIEWTVEGKQSEASKSMHGDNPLLDTSQIKSEVFDDEPKTLSDWYEQNCNLPYYQMNWDLLKKLAAKEQKSYRQISKDFNIARNTIKKYVNKEARITRRKQPVRDQWRDLVKKIWTYHSARSENSKLTAQWIFSLLVEKHGYNGSERTIRTLILEMRDLQQ